MSVHQFPQAERLARAEARCGTNLCDKWRLDRVLGVGGMASVFAATHKNGSRVAIKMLHAELSESLDIRERFLEEGYAANRVGPPGVVSVLDEGVSEDGAVFLVMELLDGLTLEQLCNDYRRLHFGEALRVADHVLGVLERAHQVGVVHRDIKPENVFVTRFGEIRILDFGIARMTESHRTHPTEVGAAMGTPVFMPPEQARGHWELIDGRTDLWALGATLYWALTGEFVHRAATLNEELLAAMTTPARSLAQVLPGAPSALVRVIDRALAFEPEERFADAGQMRAAVREVLDELRLYEETPTLVPDSAGARAAAPPLDASTFELAEMAFPLGSPGSVRPVVSTMRNFRRRPRVLVALSLAAAFAMAVGGVSWIRKGSNPFRAVNEKRPDPAVFAAANSSRESRDSRQPELPDLAIEPPPPPALPEKPAVEKSAPKGWRTAPQRPWNPRPKHAEKPPASAPAEASLTSELQALDPAASEPIANAPPAVTPPVPLPEATAPEASPALGKSPNTTPTRPKAPVVRDPLSRRK